MWHNSPKETQTGSVCHPVTINGKQKYYMSSFGPAPKRCVVMDGLFLAIDFPKLLESGVRFDEQFEFHFYDMDFCLNAYRKELKLSTWPIWVRHASHGEYKELWDASQKVFFEKWKDVKIV